MSRKVRESTNLLIEMMDDGALSSRSLAEACLNYMSEDEVEDMARVNEFILDEDELDEEELDEEEQTDNEEEYEDYDSDEQDEDDESYNH
jgi:hypothetical protein